MANSKEKEILDKIKIVITQKFESPEATFAFFDADGDGKLNRSKIIALLKEAKINRFLRTIVAGKLIERFDNTADEFIVWAEFEEAVAKIA